MIKNILFHIQKKKGEKKLLMMEFQGEDPTTSQEQNSDAVF